MTGKVTVRVFVLNMTITKINKQKKEKGRYNIFLDGDFAFGIFEDTLVKFGLRKGDEIDEKKIDEIKSFDEFNYGKKIAYEFMSYKQRSRKDVWKKLRKKKISETTILNVLALLEEQKYLNDESYAKNYLEEKLASKPMGKRLAKQKLFEKGIDKEIVEKTLAENFENNTEHKLAADLLKKYMKKKLKYKNETDKRNKFFRYLLSRGFEYETAADVINEIYHSLNSDFSD